MSGLPIPLMQDPDEQARRLRTIPTVIDAPQGQMAPQATTPPAPPVTSRPVAQQTLPRVPMPHEQNQTVGFPQYGQPAPGPAAQGLQTLGEKGPGVRNIHNPFLRTLATIGDVVAGTFAPRAEALIPGTEGNYNMRLARAQELAKAEEEGQNAVTKRGLEEAQGREAKARATGLENPQDKPITNEVEMFLRNPEAFAQYREATQKAQATKEPQFIKSGDKIVGMVDPQGHIHSRSDPQLDPQAAAIMDAAEAAAKTPSVPEGERPLTHGDQLEQALTARYQVLHPGKPLPPQYHIPSDATQKDYDRIDRALESEERATGTKAQQDQINEMRRQTMALGQQNKNERGEHEVRQAAYKAYEPALDSAERFNVMAKNYEDAVKNHDQQAMLSLLANHLGMTMGLQKGSRLTRDIIREAQQSRPWLQGMQAKFDSNGYLSGVTLTPDQMRQMVNLGRERFKEDFTKARSQAEFMGSKEGPSRIPNKSTINHYLGLSNGDVAKAKAMAAEDGWTVQ